MNKLFERYGMKGMLLSNRFVMAPMTRSRSTQPSDAPNALMAEYYGQRASAGLIITEATQISRQGKGYARTPGIYTDEQVQGWKLVTRAVHDQGGKIFLQLWHVGRVSNRMVNGLQPLAPSALIAKNTNVYVYTTGGDVAFVPAEEPRAMTQHDIDTAVKAFGQAARLAMEIGFDGVEIHGANGYLIDQFLRSNSNTRTDQYGGSKENRIRFLLEVTRAVMHEAGSDKTAVRLSPFIKFKDMDDPEILDTMLLAAAELNKFDLAYLHLCEADWDDAPQIPHEFRVMLRERFENTIIATGNKTPEEADALLQSKLVDLIGFGRKFLANPDYPERVRINAALNEITDTHTLFGGGDARGYTDYPFMQEQEAVMVL